MILEYYLEVKGGFEIPAKGLWVSFPSVGLRGKGGYPQGGSCNFDASPVLTVRRAKNLLQI